MNRHLVVCEETGTGNTTVFNQLSTYFLRRELYNSKWSNDNIIFFEGMIILSMSYGSPFFLQQKRMEKAFRVKQYKLETLKKWMSEKGYLTIIKSKNPRTPDRYSVNFDAIMDDLDSIYDMSLFDSNEQHYFRTKAIERFKYCKRKAQSPLTVKPKIFSDIRIG